MSKRLEAEVWSLDNCAGCGLCVAACSKGVLMWDQGDHPVIRQKTKTVGYTKVALDSCTFCQKFCEESCPRLERWAPRAAKVTISARARGPIKSGAPNDVARAILAAGRSTGLLDGVLMLDLDPWKLEPKSKVAGSVEQIVDNLGPQYLWSPVFDSLNKAIFELGMENIAVFSTPCSAQAIRKLKSSKNPLLKPYQDAIRLSIAIFCTGTYKPQVIEDILVKRMDVSPEQVKRIEISPDREWMRAVLWDGSVRTIPRQEAERYTRPGCGTCDDYLGESADLAVGTLGAPENTSSIIIRSRAGDIFVRNAVSLNLLETSTQVDLEALAAAAKEKDRRERARVFKDLQILMLDGLSDPYKRNEAIQQFIRLYRTPIQPTPPETTGAGCTGC
jgi:coenzyme F420 hydrogenase subunit beta